LDAMELPAEFRCAAGYWQSLALHFVSGMSSTHQRAFSGTCRKSARAIDAEFVSVVRIPMASKKGRLLLGWIEVGGGGNTGDGGTGASVVVAAASSVVSAACAGDAT